MRTIGRLDRIDIPELDLENVISKVDTGAFGCAIHCEHIEKSSENGAESLRVIFLDPTQEVYTGKEFSFEDFSMKKVRSSSGVEEMRYTILLDTVIFNKTYTVEYSLANRANMKYPVLLGRKFLAYRFLVDVTQRDLSYTQKTIKK